MSANKRRALLVLVALGGSFVAVGLVLALVTNAGFAVVLVALLIGVAVALAAHHKADAMVLSMTGAREVAPGEQARLLNLVENLCVAAGLPKPRLFVLDDDAPNACATGRDPKHAALVVTTGLLDKLSRIELEAVVAHELSHIKSRDTLVSTIAATVVGTLTRPLPAPLAARCVRWVVDADQERQADVAGVALTRYPPGLISALEKIVQDPASLRSAPRAMAHVWIEEPRSAVPSPEGGSPRPASLTRPPLEERIEALREL
ncbi:MAG: hypothetical protein AVDCRST_MAG50-2248 [uncultured Acidimicrobiales bacterium]|uniref:Peptidase M48 domain-containing protein n=1 Tax=uncultured Acidimicrobiales bacterium TaxID=310071 RepID=A0A6J4IGK5_9ACTN|nr:MAG: hypothetical protein AVDCRST_MAG50-2248 [uncultured Acidimicrobiales bacterium]